MNTDPCSSVFIGGFAFGCGSTAPWNSWNSWQVFFSSQEVCHFKKIVSLPAPGDHIGSPPTTRAVCYYSEVMTFATMILLTILGSASEKTSIQGKVVIEAGKRVVLRGQGK